MGGKNWRAGALAVAFVLALLCGTQAKDAKPADAGKAEDFKGKTFTLKEKGQALITLTFQAGKKVTLTVKSEKKTDVNLFVYDSDKKTVAKDDSPGPSCDASFTPKKSGKYTIKVVNLGPGSNSSTLKVKIAKE